MFYRTFPATAGDLNRTPLRFLILAISTKNLWLFLFALNENVLYLKSVILKSLNSLINIFT